MSVVDYLEDPNKGLVTESRPLQVSLAKYIEGAMGSPERLPHAIEAGTGIGKSYAYLINAIERTQHPRAAGEEGKTRVVVSTAMKSLQQQLYKKDLPHLQKVLKDSPFKFARQVGKANHGCMRRVYGNVYDKTELAVYKRFFDETPYWIWDEAPAKVRLPQFYANNSVGYCPKANCEHFDACSKQGYLAAKAAAEEADVLVVNHALIGADMRVQHQHGVRLLGKVDVLIVDEAHKFPEAIRNALAATMPRKLFERARGTLAGSVTHMETSIISMMDLTAIKAIPREFPHFDDLERAYVQMFIEVQQTHACGPAAGAFAATVRTSLGRLKRALGYGSVGLQSLLRGIAPREALPFSAAVMSNPAAMQLIHQYVELADKLKGYAEAIDLSVQDRLRYVVSCDTSGKEARVEIIPIQVVQPLRAYYEQNGTQPVYLSATLAVSGSFDYFGSEVGVDPHRTFLAGTPFNYAKQAYAYYPAHLLDPSKVDKALWLTYTAEECYELLMANEGHAFVLCTSYADMNGIAEGLRARGYPYPLLVQNDELKAKARDTFLRTPNATLLGTKSFWEGIDIPGLHLSLVIIPRLPFPNPSDPVIRAKSELAGDAAFSQVSLPAMLTDLKQMAGRLIRTQRDLGVVAVLDPRLHTKPYGQFVRNAVGFPKHGTTRDAALKALGQIRAAHKKALAQRT